MTPPDPRTTTASQIPLATSNGAPGDSYYGRPILKEPVWHWYIPAYFFAGGLAGASSVLAAAARFNGARILARRARFTALAGLAVSTALLVKDLGRPGRFYNMLRVAKVTSPMSVGTWLLAAYGAAAGAAVVGPAAVGPAIPLIGLVADVAAGVLGTGLSTYTGVLIGDTAVPAWRGAHRELPWLFAAGAAASAGAVASIVSPVAESAPARRLAIGAALTELGAEQVVERRLGEVAEVLHQGTPGRLLNGSKACFAAGTGVLALLGRRRPGAVAGGVLVAAGAAMTRFAVFEAGKASVRDPRYVVSPQRRSRSEPTTASAQVPSGPSRPPASSGRSWWSFFTSCSSWPTASSLTSSAVTCGSATFFSTRPSASTRRSPVTAPRTSFTSPFV